MGTAHEKVRTAEVIRDVSFVFIVVPPFASKACVYSSITHSAKNREFSAAKP